MSGSLPAFVPVLWLLAASLASLWALRHFWLTRRPAATLTIVAASATGGLWFFSWSWIHLLSWPYLALMVAALLLALATLVLPMVFKVQPQRT